VSANRSSVLASFQPPLRRWFEDTFGAPTRVQAEGWPPITRGEHTLLLSPTGSGKTLAALFACLDRLLSPSRPGAPEPGVRVVYVSPLKALAHDIERNLERPLAGIARAAALLGARVHPVTIALRTGDTPPRERARLVRDPSDVLITTPESLYLILTSRAREVLRTVETVIVDEIHALAPTKRGAHLALSLERLADLVAAAGGRDPQRIGLSATQRATGESGDEVARFLGGARPVTIVDAGEPPRLDLTLESRPGELAQLGPRVLELVRAHRSTLVFVNSRRLCERLAREINELAGEPLVRAHHGSLSRPSRLEIEDQLKAGALRGLVATSSLELGIDMDAIDLVVQVESPGSVARGLQRVGRAGHGVGQRSRAHVLCRRDADLLESAAIARRMLDAEVEAIRVPRNPLDVLAQQLVAHLVERTASLDQLHALVRRAYPFEKLSRELLVSVLDLLSGRAEAGGEAFAEVAELRPRLVWDRARDQLTARRDAKMVAIVNGGTIPDRGLYGVYLAGAEGARASPRIGELDEELVHELRPGQTFLLGASSWRVDAIERDRVLVTGAPGEPGRMPFWRGEGPGRPLEVGRALGALVRELGARSQEEAVTWLSRDFRLDEAAGRELVRWVRAQAEATGGALPTDRAITVERFRDELGDWRVCVLSPFGTRVHAPWALALEASFAARGIAIQALASDDGIVLRLPGAGDEAASSPVDQSWNPERVPNLPAWALELALDPDTLDPLLTGELARSSLFAARFRENAARALLLPRRRPGQRTPLWAQRLKAQALLEATREYPSFPITLETYREILNDRFDLPALRALLSELRAGRVRLDALESDRPSPFARGLTSEYAAAYLYQGDAPLAERRAQALTLDPELLRQLIGGDELRELLEPAAIGAVEAELQGLAAVEERGARDADQLHDLLRRLGDLDRDELAARARVEVGPLLDELLAAGRALSVRIAGQPRFVAGEDAAQPLESLIARWARKHGPFTPVEPARRLGISVEEARAMLDGLVASGRLLAGGFDPRHTGREYCDPDVLRRIRRATLERLRGQVAPVDGPALARFLPGWHGIGEPRGGLDRLRQVVAQLEGLALPWSELERAILPARVTSFEPRLLDELGALGELVWIGRGALGADDGRIALYRRAQVPLLAEPPAAEPPTHALEALLLSHLETRGASFFAPLRALAPSASELEIEHALLGLMWAGRITNDTFQPLRLLGRPRPRRGALPVGGRWSAVSQLHRAGTVDATARLHTQALTLLERWGVVSRETALVEELPGGWTEVARVLGALEEAGRVRRGWFVEGLSGAQFAHARAVDRLRAASASTPEGAVLTLAAQDPANPWGALLPWPGPEDRAARLRRVPGARVVLVGGVPVVYLEGRSLRLLPAAFEHGRLARAIEGLRALARARRHGQLRVSQIDGEPALRSPHLARLEPLGFRLEPNGIVLSG
jgi:ATP-dependent Lhr-like helicase